MFEDSDSESCISMGEETARLKDETKYFKKMLKKSKEDLKMTVDFLSMFERTEKYPVDKVDQMDVICSCLQIMSEKKGKHFKSWLGKLFVSLLQEDSLEFERRCLEDLLVIFSDGTNRFKQILNELNEKERKRYGAILDHQQNNGNVEGNLVIETWYYLTEHEAYLHLKFDKYLESCSSIQADSTLTVIDSLELKEFESLPKDLIKSGVQRRINRLKKLVEHHQFVKFVSHLVQKYYMEHEFSSVTERDCELIVQIVNNAGFPDACYDCWDELKAYFTSKLQKDENVNDLLTNLRAVDSSYGLNDDLLMEGIMVCGHVFRKYPNALDTELQKELEKFAESRRERIEKSWEIKEHDSPFYCNASRKLQGN